MESNSMIRKETSKLQKKESLRPGSTMDQKMGFSVPTISFGLNVKGSTMPQFMVVLSIMSFDEVRAAVIL